MTAAGLTGDMERSAASLSSSAPQLWESAESMMRDPFSSRAAMPSMSQSTSAPPRLLVRTTYTGSTLLVGQSAIGPSTHATKEWQTLTASTGHVYL